MTKKFSTTALITLLLIVTVTISILPGYSAPLGIGSTNRLAKYDDLLADVAMRAPGFGGMYLKGDKLMVYMAGQAHADRASAESAIASVLGRNHIPAGGIQFVHGDYDLGQLSAWYGKIADVWSIDAVSSTDLDEGSNRLRVTVDNADAIPAVGRELARAGIPRAAVNVVVSEPIFFAATLQDKVRPFMGGLQIHFGNFLCSISYNAVRNGVAGFVTASHCTNVQGGVEGTQYYQPLQASDTFIGTEIADPVYTRAVCRANGINGNRMCRWSDSSFEQLASGVTQSQGFIEKTNGVNTGSLTIAGSFRVVSEGPSVVGQVVNKVGRTTGWSQGTVAQTCVNTGVSGTKIVQICQDHVNATVGPGDSGSGVFAITSGDDVQLRGTLWGGNSQGTLFVYSPIANVQRPDELGPLDTCAVGSC